jgi:hypothetical protein
MLPPASRQFSGIFISYRRDDSAGHAGRLFDGLSDHFDEDQIFMDVDHIEPGQDFVEVLEKAVDSCEILLTVIGKHWLLGAGRTTRRLDNPDDFVRLEVAAALRRNIRVIPVLVQGAVMPRAEELPEDLAPLSRRQAIELRDQHWKTDIKRLINYLEKVLAERAAAAAQEAERQRLAAEAEERRKAEEAEQQRQREAEEARAREAEKERQRKAEEEREAEESERRTREEAAAEEERRKLEEEEKRKSEEATAAKAALERKEGEAEQERQRAAEARRTEELERERLRAAEVEHQRHKAEAAQRLMLEEAAAAERRRLQEEEKRQREEADAPAVPLAAEEQKHRDEETQNRDVAREAAAVEQPRKEPESQKAERPPDEPKPPETTPFAMFSMAAPASADNNNRVVFIALGALVAIGIIAAVWSAGSNGSPRPLSENQIAAATGTQPTTQTASLPLAATPTPSPTPEPLPTPDKAAFQRTLNAYTRTRIDDPVWGRTTLREKPKVIYGDLNGDGAEDAASSYCVPAGRNAHACELAVFINVKGKLIHADTFDGNNGIYAWALEEVHSINAGKITCIARGGDDGLDIIQKRFALVGNKLKVAQ